MCPNCRKPLMIVELHGVEMDYCLACRGVWLDSGELELIMELAGAQPGALATAVRRTDAERASRRRCPRCRRKMRVIRVGQDPAVELDRCRAGHGLWFDAGELATIVREYSGRDNAALACFFGDLFAHDLRTRSASE